MKLTHILKWNLWWRGPVHRLIVWYLGRCGGAFHCHRYGPAGRYVVLMSDQVYHSHWRLCEKAISTKEEA